MPFQCCHVYQLCGLAGRYNKLIYKRTMLMRKHTYTIFLLAMLFEKK